MEKPLADRMDDTIESLNLIISLAERKLADLRLSVSAAVPFGDQQARLVFAKRDREWKLLVDNGEPIPLHSCSLETRVRSLWLIRPLYEQLLATSEQRIAEIDKAVLATKNFLESIP